MVNWRMGDISQICLYALLNVKSILRKNLIEKMHLKEGLTIIVQGEWISG